MFFIQNPKNTSRGPKQYANKRGQSGDWKDTMIKAQKFLQQRKRAPEKENKG